jgi:hypothetical protein
LIYSVINHKYRDSNGLKGIHHLKKWLAVPGQYKFFPASAMMATAAQFSPNLEALDAGIEPPWRRA